MRFAVRFDSQQRAEPATGRLVVYVRHDDPKKPVDPDHIGSADHYFGIDADNLKPGDPLIVDDHANAFPTKLSELPAGDYAAQAVLDMHNDDSNWRREPGNLYSDVTRFTVSADSKTIDLPLTRVILPLEYPATSQAEVFQMRSKLLSDFHHRDIYLRAAVIFPIDQKPDRSYAAIYKVPGFGGNGISVVLDPVKLADDPAAAELARNTFHIYHDPESGNGHTLFANSDNNGPRGDALVTELIPALEAKYKLIPDPNARIIRGHSSGGWASLWLTLQYPQTFGACFASSPDPVDFHRLERIDIYDFANAFNDPTGKPLFGSRGETATVREENAVEQVLGPHNTSGHDWDAWQAVWGHRGADGNPANLFDPFTGAIDHAEAESYQRFDITNLLKQHPEKYAPIFRQRIRLLVGDQDTFYLNEAVELLKKQLESIPSTEPSVGYIKILPGYNHSNLGDAPEFKHWAVEIAEHLRQSGYLK
jgi:pimeloyl-ACP methyl ester carboxylesterase